MSKAIKSCWVYFGGNSALLCKISSSARTILRQVRGNRKKTAQKIFSDSKYSFFIFQMKIHVRFLFISGPKTKAQYSFKITFGLGFRNKSVDKENSPSSPIIYQLFLIDSNVERTQPMIIGKPREFVKVPACILCKLGYSKLSYFFISWRSPCSGVRERVHLYSPKSHALFGSFRYSLVLVKLLPFFPEVIPSMSWHTCRQACVFFYIKEEIARRFSF